MPTDVPVEILLHPQDAADEKARHRRELFVRRAPWMRVLGFQVIVAAVWLHNDLILGTHDPSRFVWLWAGVTAYIASVWGVMWRWYDGHRRLWMSDAVTALDTLVVAVCVYGSGGDRSWLFFLLAVRVADQVTMGSRRVVFFAHYSVASYLAVLAWVRWVDGRAVDWSAEAVKVFIVYGTQAYFALAARAADRLRERRNAAVGLARDLIAQLNEKAALLEAERRRAESASRAKSEFLSRMSHELRTPLNAILGFAQLQEMKAVDGDDREGVDQILKAGRHLLGLIDEVLDISRIEAGRMALSIEPVPVQEVVAGVLALVRPLASQRGVRVPAALAVGRDRHVRADRRRLEQVLLNLASNAIKYNRPGGEVTLAFHECGEGRVCLAVTDTGPGIEAAKMDRLFVPFERLGAEEGDVEGVGIGLALSRGLMEAMGGTLTATSTPGVGSTFVAELPEAESPLAAAEAAGHAPASLDHTDGPDEDERLVLYVEDNASNVKLVERVLAQRAGLRLLTAFQGRLGVELARQHRPAVVLLDLHLPDIGGEEVLRLLREDVSTRDIPVVVISADASAGQIDHMLASGARAYLTKPLDVRQFLGVLDEALRQGAAA